jgi:hypothetical protein
LGRQGVVAADLVAAESPRTGARSWSRDFISDEVLTAEPCCCCEVPIRASSAVST